MFQSHNGAIAAQQRKEIEEALRKVSIPQWCDCCLEALSRAVDEFAGFNPTMVRLLPNTKSPYSIPVGVFQSHNGAIAAHLPDRQTETPSFLSIPQWCDCCVPCPLIAQRKQTPFNPTMVRLLQCIPAFELAGAKPFNPTMVRLLPVNPLASICCLPSLSIPQWCDCCRS